MVTTACHYTLMTGTSPHLSPPGEDTATRLPPKGTLHQVTHTPGGSTRSLQTSPTKQNASTTLLWSNDLENSFWQAIEWLDICGRHGITLNPDKFVFGADTVTFAGFEITLDSVRPARKYLDAIQNFPRPCNITDIRSWFGLVNQVSYAFAFADPHATISPTP